MEMKIQNGHKSAIITIPEVTEAQLALLLDKTFAFLDDAPVSAPLVPKPVVTETTKVVVNVGKTEEKTLEKSVAEAVRYATEKASRPRTLPVINSERSLGSSIAERLGFSVDPDPAPVVETPPMPEHYITGILYRDFGDQPDVPHYKANYYCPNGHKGKRYVREGTPFLFCHSCSKRLKITAAHPDGFPNRDNAGAFYVAKVPHETPDPFIEAVNAKLPEIKEEHEEEANPVLDFPIHALRTSAPAVLAETDQERLDPEDEYNVAVEAVEEIPEDKEAVATPSEAPEETEAEEVQNTEGEEAASEPSEGIVEDRPKKRGRPPGTKNKAKKDTTE